MPIRTNRGRAAVYRRLWGWPLRSPRHLIGTLVALAVLVTAIGIVVPRLSTKATAAPPSRPGSPMTLVPVPAPLSSSSASPTPTTTPTRLTGPLITPTAVPANTEALQTAGRWAAAWVNHPAGLTKDQWLAALRPYTTEEYLPVMSTVELPNIPATRVAGEPTAAPGQSFPASVVALVRTDGPTLAITVVDTPAGWRVNEYDQAG